MPNWHKCVNLLVLILLCLIPFNFSLKGQDTFELVHDKSAKGAQPYASLTTLYDASSNKVPGRFCIQFNIHRFEDFQLTVVINSDVDKISQSNPVVEKCISLDTQSSVKVSCRRKFFLRFLCQI